MMINMTHLELYSYCRLIVARNVTLARLPEIVVLGIAVNAGFANRDVAVNKNFN